jgi:hypothetical protein
MFTEADNIKLDGNFKDKVINLVQELLVSVHGSGPKTRVKKTHGRLNFACPYCGDGSEDQLKKRGNLFWDSLYYHCYNYGCNTHKSLNELLSEFKPGSLSTGERIAVSDFIKSNSHKKQQDNFYNESFEQIQNLALPLSVFYQRTGTKPIQKSLEIYDYLKDRLLVKSLSNFCYGNGKLYVLNLTNDKQHVIGFQIRNMKRTSAKYLTYNLEKMYYFCGMEPPKHENINRINDVSTLFGIMNINFSSPVTIFEGPIDSFFIKNSIALCTVGRKISAFEDLDTIRYMFDNDKSGKAAMLEILKSGKQVFLWSKFIKDFFLFDYKIKDLNDLVKVCFSQKLDAHKYIDKYFSSNNLDAIYL